MEGFNSKTKPSPQTNKRKIMNREQVAKKQKTDAILRRIIKNIEWMSEDMKRKIPEIESIMSNE